MSLNVIILHISEKIACVWVAEKQGWHWWSRITDQTQKPSYFVCHHQKGNHCTAVSVASELVSMGGLLFSEIWHTIAISVVFWERDYLLRITSTPWSWDLKWECHTFFFFPEMQQFTLFFYAFLWSRRKGLIWTQNTRLEWNEICHGLAVAIWFFWPIRGYLYEEILIKRVWEFLFLPSFLIQCHLSLVRRSWKQKQGIHFVRIFALFYWYSNSALK